MHRSFGRLISVLLTACFVAIVGCTAQPSSEFMAVGVDYDLDTGDRSWSWSIADGLDDSMILVGVDQRRYGPATLQVMRFEDDWLERLRDVPQPPGELYSAHVLKLSDSFAIVGTRIAEDGEPRVFLLTSRDGRRWELAATGDIAAIASAVTTDGTHIFVGGSGGMWQLDVDGHVTSLAEPDVLSSAELTDLAAVDGTLMALYTEHEGVETVRSEDGGRSWQSPQSINPEGVDEVSLRRLQILNGTWAGTGSCTPSGDLVSRPCLLEFSAGGWQIEWLPTLGDDSYPLPLVPGELATLGVVSMELFSEGYLVSREPDGTWQRSGEDLVGLEPGLVTAVGAYPGSQQGILAISATTKGTELVAQSGSRQVRLPIGGPFEGPWLLPTGQSTDAGSQWVIRTRGVRNVNSTGGYAVVTDESPVSLTDSGLMDEEWRPATSRGLDGFRSASEGTITVLAGKTPLVSREEAGDVRLFLRDEQGIWKRVGLENREEFSHGTATALSHDGTRWLLAVSIPVAADATSASRLYSSTDGNMWEKLDGPDSPSLRVYRFCSDGRQLMVIGEDFLNESEVWRRVGGAWVEVPLGEGEEVMGCVHYGDEMVVFGARDGGAALDPAAWLLTDAGLEETDLGLPSSAVLTSGVSENGRLALAGYVSVLGVEHPTVWISTGGYQWQMHQLKVGTPDLSGIWVTSGTDGFIVTVVDRHGSSVWREATTS